MEEKNELALRCNKCKITFFDEDFKAVRDIKYGFISNLLKHIIVCHHNDMAAIDWLEIIRHWDFQYYH